jgi:hypothetical protein
MKIEIRRTNPKEYPVPRYGVFVDDVCIADEQDKKLIEALADEMRKKPHWAEDIRSRHVKFDEENV